MPEVSVSAGLLVWRRRQDRVEVLLVHPGGPFWKNKDDGAWMIPKGLVEAHEDRLAAAKREFTEETGFAEPSGPYTALGELRQRGGKIVHAWAANGDYDPAALVSNEVEISWPPRSGKTKKVPEVDRGAYFDEATARTKILVSQLPLLDRFFGETR
jgi:predicted NUDIX family NTP pyrophosphohydrolase